MPAAAGTVHPGLPPLARDGKPEIYDEGSLGGSLRVPVSKGARLVTVMLVVLLDVAMAVVGIVLLTRSSDSPAPAPAPDAGVSIGSAAPADARVEQELSGDGVRIGGDTKIRKPRPDPKPDPKPQPDPHPDPEPDPKPDPKPDSGAAPAPDAAPGPAPAPDAAAAPGPDPAPVADAATDPGPENPNADSIPDQVAVHLARSQSRLSRCYTQATKALPEDQPLEGEVDIAFEVMPTGGTRNVSVARNTTGSTTLAACISAVVAEWTFDTFEGASVDVIRTFKFRPAG